MNETTKKLPISVDQAVDRLTSELSFTAKTMIVNPNVAKAEDAADPRRRR